ncbi:TonB-dependent siderophore receptor [Pseudomonas guariconensis]|uniref:TonB-dependent siderophore receptor n=1 Tax=Pseudomonas TaxID=286 RepID=UPI002096DD0D|nr:MULTISPECIES: TonB-dependent siderophore receptor [Pseudomonas]MCO7514202.1 TonB-dependent siderophore receptor [Pseudomonas putida]MCO7593637.1 TonB-dependent siderophore receptor [Pseudomonas guariconensis]MCO7607298.1 TonB-dependent siderophore receptor [Pseudomonas guariconensis]MCU7219267.1 TonB-dependent siderophore receptor [Pseudomonas brassicacearum]
MSRAVDSFLRPSLMALAIALASPLASPALHAAEQSGMHAYDLPSAPLASTLNQIASQAGIALAIDPALVSGRQSAPVNGQYDALGALQAALRGTGLQLQQSSVGSYSLVATPEGSLALPETAINATGDYESAWGASSGYAATRTAAGTKTDTPIVETPRSLSVITRQQLDDRQVLNLNDALRYTAGVQSSGYGSDSRADWLRVRGFDPTQFLDGLPLPKGSFANPKVEPWNLERITVLRGPASSVYGQTPPGGMLDMVSRRPQAERAHQIEAQVGSNEHKQINFDSTGKIDDEGRFLYRVSGVVRDSNSPIDHIPDKRYNIAPSLTWNIDEDTKLTFISQYTRDDTGITGQFLPLQGTKLGSPVGKISHHKNLGEPDWDFYDRTYYALGYGFEHRFNDTWQFRQNLRYTKSDLEFQAVNVATVNNIDADGNVNRESGIVNEDISQFAVDNNLQANFQTGAVDHTLLMGLDHQRSNTNYQWLYGLGVPPINVVRPIYGADMSNVTYFAMQDFGQKTYQTGVYIQDQMALDNWRLTLGGREDWVHTGTVFHNKADATNTQRDKAFSGNVGLSYVFDNGVTPYVSYTESFQPASGANVDSAQSFEPTEGRQYEVGVKFQPVGSDTLLTAAVYDLRQKNVRVTEGSITRQVGELQVRGLELEATSQLTENFKTVASYTYTDTEIRKGLATEKGNRMALIPRNQATLWADYTWHSGLLDGFGIGGGVRYVGDTYGNTANTELAHVSSYTVYDASVHYDLGRLDNSMKGLSVAVEAKNLFNKDYLSNCDGYWCYYGDERNVVASVNYKF